MLQAEGWLQEFYRCHKTIAKKGRRDLQKWNKPEAGWVKCNFDGAWIPNQKRGGFGVVIRNQAGVFLGATTGPIEITSALHAELMAARQAMLLVNRLYLDDVHVQFEGDAILVVSAMKAQDSSIFSPIINDLRCFLRKWSSSKLSHVQREGNSAAHRLARFGITCAQEVVWFEEPPDLIRDIIF